MKIDSRAWIELNLDNLENNIKEINKKIDKNTQIMAVIKANAYGHGDVLIANKLNEIGIKNFAVATLEEAINLRKNNIKGEILILGYTPISKIYEAVKYNLTQTIVDNEYAKEIQKELEKNKKEEKIKAHIKINTGMNRIGIKYNEIAKIEEIYTCTSIEVKGIFSHLAVADENTINAKEFTNRQVEKLKKCVNNLKNKGYDVGKVHIQSSYGMLNYDNYKFDYVRTGIFLYGVQENDIKDFKLKPVLELKSRIEAVNTIIEDETLGYGRSYKAEEKEEKIAAVSIGYADGYPRALSNKDTKVIVNGEYGTVIGKICMDQLMIKLPKNIEVKPGDTVTLIGKEKDKEITVNYLAKKAETIPYEILSRLGNRLERIEK